MTRRLALALLVALVGASGCEETTSGADRVASLDAGSDGGGLAAAVANRAAAECTRLGTCDAFALAHGFGDVNRCEERLGGFLAWLVTLPGSGYTADGLGACADQIAATDCTTFLSLSAVPSSCAPTGSRAVGEACLHGSQCTTGFCPSAGYACATCAAAPAIGSPCGAGTPCASGQVCSAAGKCAVVAKLGEACSTSNPCDVFLECQTTCKALPSTAGVACGSATANAACDERANLVCSSAPSGKCVQLTFVDTGSACGLTGNVASLCKAMGSCVAGVCKAGPVAGDACAGASCQVPDQCVGGHCAAPPSAEACP